MKSPHPDLRSTVVCPSPSGRGGANEFRIQGEGKKRFWLLLCILLLAVFLVACQQAPAEPETVTVIETVIVVEEKEGETVTIVETVIVEVEAAPATEEPAAEEPMEEESPAPTEEPIVETAESSAPQPTATPAVQPTAAPTATQAPQPTQAQPTQPQPTPTPVVEPRRVEVEWPDRLFLGDSDVVRMALIPSESGYTLTTEFPDHETIVQDVPVVRPAGYDLYAVGRLDGVGFVISPPEDQVRGLPLDEVVIWHWSLQPQQPGQQRLTVSLTLRWVPNVLGPQEGNPGSTREAVVYSKGLDVRVNSFFGLKRGQALTTSFFGLLFGLGLSLFAAVYRSGLRAGGRLGAINQPQIREPNLALQIESPPGLHLHPEHESLLRAIFKRYARLVIHSEFLSGYSGARTFLLLPVRSDGRSDAYTIAKIGESSAIQQEYLNYEAFVKTTLPPVTARIQAPPVTLRAAQRAALQYTFIGEPGSTPTSLRQALLDNPDPALLTRLFETFGPNWWMQRSPWTFRLAQEYDRLLPPHWVLEPDTGRGQPLDGAMPPGSVSLSSGERISLRNFHQVEGGPAEGKSYYSIKGQMLPGHPQLRLRWLGEKPGRSAVGRVIASRDDLLRSYVTGFELFGLPDPLAKLPSVLGETLIGSRAIIHGDLNLENILVGPGNIVWLIDFATTREGHPLMDFAHLEAEIIAHVIAKHIAGTEQYLELLREVFGADVSTPERASVERQYIRLFNLFVTLHEIAAKCLANPSQPREYELALLMSCLGALKYRNLDQHQKHLLYLTAAFLSQG